VPSRDEVHRITTAQPGASPDLVSRERTYLVMMGTRMVAIIVAVVVPGIWRWIAIALGVFLPYIAVVLVNAVRTKGTEDDPQPFVPTHKVALSDRPFEGTVIPHED
jgi:Flp pilus assembly protein TadB